MRCFAMLVLAFSLSSSAFAQQVPQPNSQFPIGPNPQLTPGTLCTNPDSYRYPEHIGYCSRAVDTNTKRWVIHNYDVQLGFSVEGMDRGDFKIDHYIPLCAGGGNDVANLWPQNKSVYSITDPLEPLVCNLMAAGKITQAQAVEYIHEGKGDLTKTAGIIAQLSAM